MKPPDRDRETRVTRLHRYHRSEKIYHITAAEERIGLDEHW